jgi:hypothetical protein
MSHLESAKFRATTGTKEAFGTTPQEALNALMQHSSGDAFTPIIIWPYNMGDVYFSDAQQARLQELKSRRETMTADESAELEGLVAAAFDATVARTKACFMRMDFAGVGDAK